MTFFGFIIGEESKPTLIDMLKEYYSTAHALGILGPFDSRRGVPLRRSRKRHRIQFEPTGHFGFLELLEPGFEKLPRIARQILQGKGTKQVVTSQMVNCQSHILGCGIEFAWEFAEDRFVCQNGEDGTNDVGI